MYVMTERMVGWSIHSFSNLAHLVNIVYMFVQRLGPTAKYGSYKFHTLARSYIVLAGILAPSS